MEYAKSQTSSGMNAQSGLLAEMRQCIAQPELYIVNLHTCVAIYNTITEPSGLEELELYICYVEFLSFPY